MTDHLDVLALIIGMLIAAALFIHNMPRPDRRNMAHLIVREKKS